MLAASARTRALAGGGTPVKGGGPVRPVLEVGPIAAASSFEVVGALRTSGLSSGSVGALSYGVNDDAPSLRNR